jgi:hypothetical protein
MDRRSVLQGAIGLGTIALAGCLGDDEQDFTLSVVDWDFGENDEGYLQTWAVVSNAGNNHQEGTLYVRADVNDDSLVRVRDVSLDAHKTREYTITYDILMEDVTSFSMDVDVEPPEN